MKLFKQSFALLLACLIVLIIITTELTLYITAILGVTIAFSVIYIVIMRRLNKGDEIFVGSTIEVFSITLALLLGIFLTGGLNSNLYFLLYFLIFGLVFLFQPTTVFVLLAGLLIVFFPSLSEGDLFSNIIKLGSLAFLAPISYFFGREFQRREKLEKNVNDKTGQIIEDAKTLKSKTRGLPEEDLDQIDDIIENSSELRKKVADDK